MITEITPEPDSVSSQNSVWPSDIWYVFTDRCFWECFNCIVYCFDKLPQQSVIKLVFQALWKILAQIPASLHIISPCFIFKSYPVTKGTSRPLLDYPQMGAASYAQDKMSLDATKHHNVLHTHPVHRSRVQTNHTCHSVAWTQLSWLLNTRPYVLHHGLFFWKFEYPR